MKRTSNAAEIAHNLGLAAWFGGTLLGQVALNPTVSSISDRREPGRVLNESWGRFNAANAPALLAWRLGGLNYDAELRAPALARVKDLLLGGAAVNAVVSGILGTRIARQSSGGATPVESGTEPAPETPEESASSQRMISFFGTGSLVLSAAAIAVSGMIENEPIKPCGILSRLLTS
ncbi:MAG TPA: hypothetical protein VKA51_00090 [Rubrobacteraceae bacterium]|nr:hypothetical protein [Rubrobacteraceae bacterium]